MARMNAVCLILLLLPAVTASHRKKSEPQAADTKEAKITRALSAAPATVSKDAKVIDHDSNGAETVLREGGCNGEVVRSDTDAEGSKSRVQNQGQGVRPAGDVPVFIAGWARPDRRQAVVDLPDRPDEIG